MKSNRLAILVIFIFSLTILSSCIPRTSTTTSYSGADSTYTDLLLMQKLAEGFSGGSTGTSCGCSSCCCNTCNGGATETCSSLVIVTDEQENPIADATVRLSNGNTYVTDEYGTASIYDLSAGFSSFVTVTMSGYVTKRTSLQVQGNECPMLNIVLKSGGTTANTCSATFVVFDGTLIDDNLVRISGINDAMADMSGIEVAINGATYKTVKDGSVTIPNLTVNKNYDYIVNKAGYDIVSDTYNTAADCPNNNVIIAKTHAVLQSIAITPSTASTTVGQSVQFTATGYFDDGTSSDVTSRVAWTSSDISKATIGINNGLAMGVAAGTSTITVKSSVATGSITASKNLTVTSAADELNLLYIHIKPEDFSIFRGQTQQYIVVGTYLHASDMSCVPADCPYVYKKLTDSLTWSSANDRTVAIDQNGLAAAGPGFGGTTNISVTYAPAGGSSMSSSTSLTIKEVALDHIVVTPADLTVLAGDKQQFTAKCIGSDSTEMASCPVTWTSSDSSVATIDQNGLAATNVLNFGYTTITASTNGISATANLGSGLTAVRYLTDIKVTPATASISTYATQAFTATCMYSDKTQSACPAAGLTWASGNAAAATINATTGVATGGVIGGISYITATLGKVTSSVAQRATITVTVDYGTGTITDGSGGTTTGTGGSLNP